MEQQKKMEAARLALACMDLTSLNDSDTGADIVKLCAKASGPAGRVAAVCVWPRFARVAWNHTKAGVHVAAVVNFPSGDLGIEDVLAEIELARHNGADEIDLVLPYKRFLSDHAIQKSGSAYCLDFVSRCKAACGIASLKVILETGAFPDAEAIAMASHLALDAGANFIKTSTGKIAQGATLEAARAMMGAIASREGCLAGFKASGGVRTVEEASSYLDLAKEILGPSGNDPKRFRIGASGLLSQIELCLAPDLDPEVGVLDASPQVGDSGRGIKPGSSY